MHTIHVDIHATYRTNINFHTIQDQILADFS
jgi:hypothetical protein